MKTQKCQSAKKIIPQKGAAFTIIELLVALGIGAIVVAAAINMMGGVYFSQKKIQVTHDFSSEVRLLMERVTQIVRNNTLDYDRYFIKFGPAGGVGFCQNFNDDQTPQGVGILANNEVNRQSLEYAPIFFWDTGTKDGIPDRNLGGKLPDGVNVDPCTVIAWNDNTLLFLINADRNVQTAMRQDGFNPAERHVQLQTRLGDDTNDDGNADRWTPYTEWDGSACDLFNDAAKTDPFVGGDFVGDVTEDFCTQAHDWITISPEQLEVTTFAFTPSPSQDPFLSFAVDEAQIHPLALIFLNATLRDPGEFGMQGDEIPQVSLQTSVSSRVFGNTRE